jgi:putative ABC transport system permease protein
MNILQLSISYLRYKPLNSLLNVVLFGFGTAIIVLLLLFSNQMDQRLTANARGIDLVVGAKGSPMQLILCNIFHIDFPTGNISLREAEALVQNRMIKSAIPMALGDSYKGWRIVGTDTAYAGHYKVELAEGQLWQNTMEVTLGARVAAGLGVQVGDSFEGQHGMGEGGHLHEGSHYRVVGVLKASGSVVDNLILTSVPSVWQVHEVHSDATEEEFHENHDQHHADHAHTHDHDVTEPHGHEPKTPQRGTLIPGTFPQAADSLKEITSLLIKYRSPMAAITLPRMINQQTSMQAASPSFETARLFSLVGTGVEVIRWFAWIIMAISGLSIFISLYNSMKDRVFDLALMRAQGASKGRLFAGIILEGLLLTTLGSLLGMVISHLVLEWIASALPEASQSGFTGWVFYPEELYVLAAALGVGVLASLLPAMRVFKTDISKILAQG